MLYAGSAAVLLVGEEAERWASMRARTGGSTRVAVRSGGVDAAA